MNQKLFTIYDQKSKLYCAPFCFAETGQALRAFVDTVNDPSTAINKHPEDYLLYEIGSFDDSTAMCDPFTGPALVANGIEVFINPDAPAKPEGEKQRLQRIINGDAETQSILDQNQE